MKKKVKIALSVLLGIAVAASAGGFFTYLIRGSLSGEELPADVAAVLDAVQSEKAQGADVRIMSSNLLVDYESWGGTPAKPRAKMYTSVVDTYRPDVIGIQEMSDAWYCLLRQNLPDGYKMLYPVSSGVFVRMTALVYNAQTLTLVEHGQQVYTQATNPRLRRVVWGLFETKQTGERFVVTTTHLDLLHDDMVQAELPVMQSEAKEMVQLVKDLQQTYACPVFATGDFNAKEPSAHTREVDAPSVYTYLCEQMTDTKYVAKQSVGGSAEPLSKPTYDHVFYAGESGSVHVLKYELLSDRSLQNMSDHYPIYVDVQLSEIA